MTTRFNYTKPSLIAVTSKKKVLQDFRNLQQQLNSINQEVTLQNSDPTPVATEFNQTEKVS